jgi:endonuclease/exonuclease/phosphatase family metal-dependent hydrolase
MGSGHAVGRVTARRLGGLVAWLLLALPACGDGGAAPGTTDGPRGTPGADAATLDVMSYNMHWAGPSGSGLDEVAEIVAASGADLVGLQEVRRFAREQKGGDYHCQDQPALLAGMLRRLTGDPWEWAFAPNSEGQQSRKHCLSVTSEPRAEGVAILSRYPIVERRAHDLPHARGLAEARVRAPGGDLTIYSVHLHSTSQAKRMDQVHRILELLGQQGGVVFLTGDLNGQPDSEEVRTLLTATRDSFAEAGQGRARSRQGRVDYVLVRGDVRVRSAEVIQRTVSDHRPVVARFER